VGRTEAARGKDRSLRPAAGPAAGFQPGGGRLVVVGELMLDVLFVSAGREEERGLYVRPGGSAANLALTVSGADSGADSNAAGGVPAVAVVGRTGPDPNGAWVARALRERGVELPVAPAASRPTGYVVLHRRDWVDRVAYVERGANALLGPDDVDESVLDGAAWLHLSGYCLIEPGPTGMVLRLAAAARRRGIPVSFDPGVHQAFAGRSPDELSDLFHLGLDGGPEHFLPSGGLACFLGGASSPAEASAALARAFAGLVVVKDGAAGAWVGGERVGLDAPVPRPQADVNGAGDVFNAAYILAAMGGASAEEAAGRANGVAARFVAGGGGRPGGTAGSGSGPGPRWVRVRCQEPPVLISACLLATASAYDGRDRGLRGAAGLEPAEPHERVFLPVCPEQAGGLGTPRTPSEIRVDDVVGAGRTAGAAGLSGSGPSGRGDDVIAGRAAVVDRSGRDVSEAFLRGARRAVSLARAVGACRAVLKDGSPSCGVTQVYDGTFSGRPVPGRGVAAAALAALGVEVVPEARVRPKRARRAHPRE